MKITIQTVGNDEEHASAMERVDYLIGKDDLTLEESSELDVLSTLIESYEKKRWPLDCEISPVDAIKVAMEEKGLKQVDLVPLFGNKSQVSAIMNGRRPLTVKYIRILSKELHIPSKILLGI